MSEVLTLRSYLSPNYEELYRYLAGQIGRAIGREVRFEVGHDFREFLTNPTDLALACGFWYVQNADYYEPLVAPVMTDRRYGRQPVYFVDVLTRADEQPALSDLASLAGKTFGFNEIQSFSGYHALVAELAKQGRTTGFFERLVKTGSHLNSLEKLLQAEIDFATLDSTVLDFERARRPALAPQLRVVTSLGPYPAPPLLINRAIEPSLRSRLLDLLRGMSGPRLADFGLLGYRAVDRAFYAPLAALYETQPVATTR